VQDSAREGEQERWGVDERLVSVLGEVGARRVRGLFDSYPEPVGMLWPRRDAAGAITDFAFGYGNPAMLRRSGLPPSTAERYSLLEALPQMRGSEAFAAYVRVCETGEPWVKEIVYDTPFGDGYMLGTFIHRAARLGDGLVVFLHDLTEQRRMENELRNYANVVAHDLSEPLAGISLLVTLLGQRPEDPPDPEVLTELRAGVDRARALIDGVLVYARSGELRPGRVDLGAVVGAVAHDLRHRIESSGATLDVARLPEVRGDEGQLRRVLQNLIQNALKFRGEDAPRIRVRAELESREWVVTVVDNGIGVAPEHASRVFDMFSRVGPSSDGAGIGLAVCRRIVEAHGGRIWVEPSEAGGSAFRFTLPQNGQAAGASLSMDAANSTK
jgi:signal transduction histidine kinase